MRLTWGPLPPKRQVPLVLQKAQGHPMTIQRIKPGPRMSGAVVHGNTVYLAGQVANQSAGQSVTEQTTEILAIIDSLLAEAGTDKSKILMANIWLTDMGTFQEMNAVWDAWVSAGNTPARATVEAKLATPAFKVEIAVIAAK
jgi:enamine deaminase RidA (YjgF/YER057c/UK114 family)